MPLFNPGVSLPVAVTDGGVGIASYAVGDMLYASATTTLSALAAVAVGAVLVSAGINTAPAWSTTSASKFGSIAVGGATIGVDVFSVTGTSTFTGNATVTGSSSTTLFLSTSANSNAAIAISTNGSTRGFIGWTTNNSGTLGLYDGSGTARFSWSSTSVGVRVGSGDPIAFSSTAAASSTVDAGFSRDSVLGAGNIDVGNGTANDKSGTLNLAKIVFSAAASGIVLKQGANGLCGTFVANGVTPVTVSNTNVAITDAIIISLNTVGGTVGANPPDVQTITAGVGFTVKGLTLDTSTYNYAIIKNAA